MNLVMVLAVHATISKALGLPLRHPGSEANARALYNVTDSGLLARACVWMATDPAAANERLTSRMAMSSAGKICGLRLPIISR